MKKIAKLLAFAVALMFVLSACGGAGSTAPSSATKKVGVLLPGSTGYFVPVREGLDKGAAEFGFELIYADAEWDASKQLSQAEDFIQQKVDMIAICSADAESAKEIVAKANEAGIPIVAFTNTIGTDPTGAYDGLLSYIGQNEIDTGRIVGEYAIELLGEAGGNVAMIEGQPGTSPQINRAKGFEEAIAAVDNIEIVVSKTSEWQKDKAISITEDWIQSGIEFNLLFAHDAGSAAGAAQALEEAGMREDVFVLGIDGSKEALESVASGLIDATTWMSPTEEGYKTTQVISDYFAGNTVAPVTQIVQVLITKDNVAEYVGEF